VELSVELDDRFVGPADGFDLIVRHGPFPDNTWIVKRLAPSKRLLVASPGYLDRQGVPESLSDLEAHRGIIYSNRGASDWRFRQSGRWLVVHPKAILRVNNGVMMRDAALSGLGITLLPTFVCNDALAAGQLQHIDVGAEAEAANVFIAYPRSRRSSVKVGALIDHLCAAFRVPAQRSQPAR
jgi:DNA-binding transcriptional LysR family regulator